MAVRVQTLFIMCCFDLQHPQTCRLFAAVCLCGAVYTQRQQMAALQRSPPSEPPVSKPVVWVYIWISTRRGELTQRWCDLGLSADWRLSRVTKLFCCSQFSFGDCSDFIIRLSVWEEMCNNSSGCISLPVKQRFVDSKTCWIEQDIQQATTCQQSLLSLSRTHIYT